jgi:DNA-binding MarR family transcriptional regulator
MTALTTGFARAAIRGMVASRTGEPTTRETAATARKGSEIQPMGKSRRPASEDEWQGLGTLDGVFGLHVGLAHSAIIQDFKRNFEPLQLTPKQTSLLWIADESPGIAQVDVARLLLVDRATMLGITNSLTRRGLIERRRSPNGGRRIGLHLTAEGAEMLSQARRTVAKHEKGLKSRFTPEELEAFASLLKRIYR